MSTYKGTEGNENAITEEEEDDKKEEKKSRPPLKESRTRMRYRKEGKNTRRTIVPHE